MKFIINTQEIKNIIQNLVKISIKNNLNPIFESVYLKNENHNLTIRVANFDVIAECNIPIKSEINGQVMVNINLLNKILNNLNKTTDNLFFELENNILSIKNDKNITYLETLNENIFPEIKSGGEKILSIEKDIFKNLIKKTYFACAINEIKPEIASVFIYNKDDILYSVGTDSYRLAEQKLNYEIKEEINLLIPQKNINNLISFFDISSNNKIDFYKKDDNLIIEDKNNFLLLRIINGNYPDYRQLFPKEYQINIILRKDVFINSLNFVNIINQKTSIFKLEYIYNNKIIKLTSEEKGVGKIIKEIEVESDYNQDFEVYYNCNYFIEGLSYIDEEKIELKFTTLNRPVFIEGLQNKDFTYLVMPINR